MLFTPNGHPDTRLNGNGRAALNFVGSTDALFGLALSTDHTQAVAVGLKGVKASGSRPINSGEAKIVRFSLSGIL